MIIKDTHQDIKNAFQEAGIDTASLDARLLICHALNMSHEEFVLNAQRGLQAEQRRLIDSLAAQRLQGRPVAKIIGQKEFYGHPFYTSDETLDPRPDSETLVEAVLEYSKEKMHLLDMGTGTGCLILSVLKENPYAHGIAIDQSKAALDVAKRNALHLEVEDRVVFIQSDWFENVAGQFDVIISNPPYIPESDIPGLAKEVRIYDPMAALTGGQDGLDPYRHIIPRAGAFLKPGGMLAFEVGQGQAAEVAQMLEKAGFEQVAIKPDLAGIGRVVVGIKLQ